MFPQRIKQKNSLSRQGRTLNTAIIPSCRSSIVYSAPSLFVFHPALSNTCCFKPHLPSLKAWRRPPDLWPHPARCLSGIPARPARCLAGVWGFCFYTYAQIKNSIQFNSIHLMKKKTETTTKKKKIIVSLGHLVQYLTSRISWWRKDWSYWESKHSSRSWNSSSSTRVFIQIRFNKDSAQRLSVSPNSELSVYFHHYHRRNT